MSSEKKLLFHNPSTLSVSEKKTEECQQHFSQVYQSLCKTINSSSIKNKFIPLIDISKHRKNQNKKTANTLKYLNPENDGKQSNYVNLPFILPQVRVATKQQKQKIKSGQIQGQKFSVNEAIFIHQKQVLRNDQIIQLPKYEQKNAFRSILREKNKKITSLSKRNFFLNPQNTQRQKKQNNTIQLNKKTQRISSERTDIDFQKNKLIETILQVQEKKNKEKKQFFRLQLSQKNVLNYSFGQEQMLGDTKQLDTASFRQQKKTKWKSIEKIYALKEQIKNQNSPKKTNWKSVPFPLIKLEKQYVTKIFQRYLRVQNITAPSIGFYRFYVGEGNNSQIIRQCLKNRGYWMQVQSINQKPNFVWTQLPCEQFYTKQTRILQQKQSKRTFRFEDDLNEIQIGRFLKYQQSDYVKGCEKILSPKIFKNFLNELIQKFNKGFKVESFSDVQKHSKPYINQVKSIKFQNMGTKSQISNEQGQPLKANNFHIHNHLKNSKIIGNKKDLHKMFLEHCYRNNEDINEFIPQTMNINLSDYFDEDVFIFDIQTDIPQGPWLVKPGEDTNRGHGIKIVQTIQDLVKQVKKRLLSYQEQERKSEKEQKEKSLIIQKYIEPFLYNGRKFDIRVWALWAKNQLWFYREGYLRTSSKQFTLQSTNRFVHLTNDAVQINSADYGKYQQANKLSFAQFQKYLDKLNENKQSDSIGKHYDFSQIYKQLKILTEKLFLISRKDLFEATLNFQLFGLDFLVGKDMKVWLIQCNTNPSLQVHCSLQSRLVSNLIDNMISIVVDPLFQCPEKRLGKEALNIYWNQQNFKFEIIIDGDQQDNEKYHEQRK